MRQVARARQQDANLFVHPGKFIPEVGTLPLIATVTPIDWKDSFGRDVQEDPTNNVARVNLSRLKVNDGATSGAAIFAPTTEQGRYEGAYPHRDTSWPIPRIPAIVGAENVWASASHVHGSANPNVVSHVGVGARFTGEAFYTRPVSSENPPAVTNFTGYQFWDPTKQQLDMSHFVAAVLGSVAPSISAANANPTNPAYQTKAFSTDKYTKECTTSFPATPAQQAATMTWAPCDSLDVTKISGMRFVYKGSYAGASYPGNPNSMHTFTQVPFKAVAPAVTRTETHTWWSGDDFTDVMPVSKPAVLIAGNVVSIADKADPTSVGPFNEITYTINPTLSNGSGMFLPGDVHDLRLVNDLDPGIAAVDFTKLDPFWTYSYEVPFAISRGADGIPYTRDDGQRPRIVFKPAGPITTTTKLPPIKYVATLGALVPPQTPNNKTVAHDVSIEARDAAPEIKVWDSNPPYVLNPKSATAPVGASSPEIVSYAKHLVSEPLQVEDEKVIWRLEWANLNSNELGEGTFVDVFPKNGDGRKNSFDGTLTLVGLAPTGSANAPETVIEMTSRTGLGTGKSGEAGEAPAAGLPKTTIGTHGECDGWCVVKPTDKSTWPKNPTAIRVTIKKFLTHSEGYGAIDLQFKATDHKKDNSYENTATGTVIGDNRQTTIGAATPPEVKVTASSGHGYVWIDKNRDGKQDSDEPGLTDAKLKLYRLTDSRDLYERQSAMTGRAVGLRARSGLVARGATPSSWTDSVIEGATSCAAAASQFQLESAVPFRETTTDADGKYSFGNLHSDCYQIVVDAEDLKKRGYKLTTQNAIGSSAVTDQGDSDADPATGAMAPVDVHRSEDLYHMDAGVIGLGLSPKINGSSSMARTYNWDISKVSTKPSVQNGEAEVTYTVTTTALEPTDKDFKFAGEITVKNNWNEKFKFDAAVTDVTAGLPQDSDKPLECKITGIKNADKPADKPKESNGKAIEVSALDSNGDPGTVTLLYSCTGEPKVVLSRVTQVELTEIQVWNPALSEGQGAWDRNDPARAKEKDKTYQPITAKSEEIKVDLTEINKHVQVVDQESTQGSPAQDPKTIAKYTWAKEDQGKGKVLTYESKVQVPADNCVKRDNTAAVWAVTEAGTKVGNSPIKTATASVTIGTCPIPTPTPTPTTTTPTPNPTPTPTTTTTTPTPDLTPMPSPSGVVTPTPSRTATPSATATPSVTQPAHVPSETAQPTPSKPSQVGKRLPNTGGGMGFAGGAALILGLSAAAVLAGRRRIDK